MHQWKYGEGEGEEEVEERRKKMERQRSAPPFDPVLHPPLLPAEPRHRHLPLISPCSHRWRHPRRPGHQPLCHPEQNGPPWVAPDYHGLQVLHLSHPITFLPSSTAAPIPLAFTRLLDMAPLGAEVLVIRLAAQQPTTVESPGEILHGDAAQVVLEAVQATPAEVQERLDTHLHPR